MDVKTIVRVEVLVGHCLEVDVEDLYPYPFPYESYSTTHQSHSTPLNSDIRSRNAKGAAVRLLLENPQPCTNMC